MKRLNKPFSALGMSEETCLGVPESRAESRGVSSSTYYLWSFSAALGNAQTNLALLSLARKFAVFSAVVGYGFVVKGFAEAIGIVAVFGFECLGKGVAFGFKNQAYAFVII